MSYIRIPFIHDTDDVIFEALQRLKARFPGMVPRDHHLHVAALQEMARIAALVRQTAALVPGEVFAEFGRSMVGVPQEAGAFATGTARLHVVDDAGYTIPALTTLAWPITGDRLLYLETIEDLVIPSGAEFGDVEVEAADVGVAGNGWGPGELRVIDQRAALEAAELIDETSGGVDPEEDWEYRARLSEELQLMAPRPILARDFAVFARRVTGVFRAAAIDNYDPGDLEADPPRPEDDDKPRAVTVIPLDATGRPVDSEIVEEMLAYLHEHREINFEVWSMEPTYTPVHVEFQVSPAPGVTPEAAVEAAEESARRFIDAATWSGGGASPPVWRLERFVRLLELAGAISATPEVDYVLELTINGASADFELAGVAPLPTPLDADTDPSTVTGSLAA